MPSTPSHNLLASRPETLLLTGATGTVSRSVLAALTGNPHLRLRALVRDEARAASLRGQGVELVRGDLDDATTLPRAFEAVDALWLVTAPGPRAPENSMNAIWAARQAGIKRVVRLSAVGAAVDAPTRNGRLHALSDHEVMMSGLAWTVLKPHFFMQNLFYAAGVIAQGLLPFAFAEGRLGVVDTRDVGAFAAHVLTAPAGHAGKTYTLTGPSALSGAQMADALSHGLGRAVTYLPASLDEARAATLASGATPWIAEMMVEYSRAYSNGWGDVVSQDFANVMGRAPGSLTAFARDHAAIFAAAAA